MSPTAGQEAACQGKQQSASGHGRRAKKHFPSLSWKLTAIVGLCVSLVCCFVRFYGLNDLSFDTDETFTWHFSRTIASSIIDVVIDVHPPAYFTLISIWRKIFGDSEVSLRFPSVLFSLLTLIALLMYANIIDREKRLKFVLYASVLFCFLPYEIHLARHARSYTMMIFLCTAFAYCYLRLSVLEERRYLLPTILLGGTALYTNYQSAVFLVATIAAGLLCGSSRSRMRTSLTVVLGMAIICLPLLPVLLLQACVAVGLSFHGHFRDVMSVTDFLLVLSPSSEGFVRDVSYSSLVHCLGLAFSAIAIGIVLAQFRALWRFEITRVLLIQVALMIGVVINIRFVHEKMMCIFIPSAIVLLATALAEFSRPLNRMIATIFVAGFAALSLAVFPYKRLSPDWRGTCQALDPLVAESAAPMMLVVPSLQLIPLQYYLHRGHMAKPPPIWADLKDIAVLLSPVADGLKFRIVADPGFRLEDGTIVRSSRAFWWIVCRIFAEDSHASDVFFVRLGSGDILEGIANHRGLPIRKVGRFGLLSLYHITRADRIWCVLFDSEYYVRQRPDIAEQNEPPLRVYLLEGAKAWHKANPHPLFDTAYYLREYPDVARSGLNPLLHFIEYGAKERLNPHPLFDTAYYLREYPDVARSGLNPLLHFIEYGAKEKRKCHPLFGATASYLVGPRSE